MQQYPQCPWPADSLRNEIVVLDESDFWTIHGQLCKEQMRTLTVKFNGENTGVVSPTFSTASSAYQLKPWMFAERLLKPGQNVWLHCFPVLCGTKKGGKAVLAKVHIKNILQGSPPKGYSPLLRAGERRWFILSSLNDPWLLSRLFATDGLKCHQPDLCFSCTENRHVQGAGVMYCCSVLPSSRAFLAIIVRHQPGTVKFSPTSCALTLSPWQR